MAKGANCSNGVNKAPHARAGDGLGTATDTPYATKETANAPVLALKTVHYGGHGKLGFPDESESTERKEKKN